MVELKYHIKGGLFVLSAQFGAVHAQGSLFYVHLLLINFPDKHCICVHKHKIRHTSFEIYRILKLSFRVTLYCVLLFLFKTAYYRIGIILGILYFLGDYAGECCDVVRAVMCDKRCK